MSRLSCISMPGVPTLRRKTPTSMNKVESPRVGDPLDSNGVQEVLATTYRQVSTASASDWVLRTHHRKHPAVATSESIRFREPAVISCPEDAPTLAPQPHTPSQRTLFSAATFFMIVPPGPSTANSRPCSTSLIP